MENKMYRLTPAQDLLMFSQKFSLLKQVNNVCTLMFTEHKLDDKMLDEAVSLAIQRNDCLQIRLVKDGKSFKQYFAKDIKPEPVERMDFTGKTDEQIEAVLSKIAAKKVMSKPGQQLYKLYILKGTNGETGFFLNVSHLILDSWGVCIFFSDILKIYFALRDGTEMPKPLNAYEDILQTELAYLESPKYEADRAFWEAEFSRPEPMFTCIEGLKPLEKHRKKKKDPNYRAGVVFNFDSRAAHVVRTVPADVVEGLTELCSRERIPMQAAFMLGYRSWLSKQCNQEKDVSFYAVVARRGTLKEKFTGGSRVQILYYRTIIEPETTLLDAMKAMNEEQNKVYRHINFPSDQMMDMFHKMYGKTDIETYPACSLTFQPFPLQAPDGTKLKCKWICNGASGNMLYTTVMDDDGSGALRCYYEYQKSVTNEGTLNRMHEYIVELFREIIKNPDKAIGEVIK